MRGRVLLLVGLLVIPSLVAGPAAAHEPGSEKLLVSLSAWPAPSSTEQAVRAHGGSIEDRFPFARTLLVEAPPASADAIEALPNVALVTPDAELSWNLASSKAAVGLTGQMHEAGLTGSGVTIALVDSGIDTDHPGLAPNVVGQWTVSSEGTEPGTTGASKHGTHVAGVLAGTGEGAAGHRGDVSGVAPEASLVSLDISQQFTTSNALRAFEWIYENHEEEDIRVVANSWGRQRDPARYEPEDPLIRASDALVDEGIVVVFSAGNGGPDASQMTLEGTNPSVITVGAATDSGDVEAYSSRGPIYEGDRRAIWTKPDLVAPGSHIVSTRAGGSGPGTNYVVMNGTSMAAPHVAGAAALLIGLSPELTPAQVKGLLTQSARDVGAAGVDDASGAGMLSVSGAVQLVEQAGNRTTEEQATTRKQGELTGSPSGTERALQTASVDREDRFSIEVPANATAIHGTVRWDGRSALEVRLVDPEGEQAQRVLVEGEEEIRLDAPAPGRWHVELAPTDLSRGQYDAELTVTWLVHHDGIEIPIAQHRSRSGTFPSSDGVLSPFGSSWIPGVPNVVPMAAGGVITALMLVGRLRGGRKADPEVRRSAEHRFERVE